MDLLENIKLAITSIRSNLMRAMLTLLIIAFGIMALVGILTAIDSAIYSLNSNLSYLGANTFDVDPKGESIRGNRRGRSAKRGQPITYRQAMEFKERYDFPARASVSMHCSSQAVIKYKNEETNPNVFVFAVDENYLAAKGFDLSFGRNFTSKEALQGSSIAIIGHDIVKQLFGGQAVKAIDKIITAGNIKLRVVGVLESKGSSMNQSEDRRIMIPLQTGKRYFASPNENYNLLVAVNEATQIDNAIAEATGTLRNVRGLKAREEIGSPVV